MQQPSVGRTGIVYEEKELYPGHFVACEIHDHYLDIRTDNLSVLRIYILEDDIVRFRFTTEVRFEDDFSYAIDPSWTPAHPDFTVDATGDFVEILTASLRIEVSKNHLYVRIFNKDGVLLNEDEKGFHWEEHPVYGGNIVQMSKKIIEGEAFYGLGDKPVSDNLRGKRFINWGTDEYGYTPKTDPLYKNINFFYGLHHDQAYGIFYDNTFKSFFDFGAERTDVTSFWSDGGEMNYYFIYGPRPLKVAEKYAQLTGTADMPPLWALGYQQCKWSYYPEAEVRDIANTMRKHRIPCDAIYLDIDYMDGFRCFTWDKEKFPDPKGMISDLKSQGFHTVVIIDPGIKIDHNYDVFQEAFANGFFCRRADGPFAKGKVWPGDCYFPDFTKPEVRRWWRDLFEDLIANKGVAGVWNDMNEPALFEVPTKTFPDDVRMDYDGHPCSHRKGHNIYGMQMARATYQGVKKFLDGKRPLIITRSGYNGMQRFSSVWTGDNLASWEHLEIAHYQTLRLNICGISFCGSDIGGFIGQPSGELYVRWLQMAVFHPFMRTHSSGDHGDQEPWSFGERYLDYARHAIELRYKLLPYIYTCFYQYHREGTPMLRPLEFSGHPPAAGKKVIQAYLGDNLIYAPVTKASAIMTDAYLPPGEWYEYTENQLYNGGQTHRILAGLDKVPFFIRGGTLFPEYPVMQYTGEKELGELTLKLFVGTQSNTSYLYTDNGKDYNYTKGQFRYAAFEYVPGNGEIRITQTIEGNYVPEFKNYLLKLIGMSRDKVLVAVDGADPVEYDVAQGIPLKADFSEIYLK